MLVQLYNKGIMAVVIDTSAVIAVIVNEPEKSALVRKTSGADLLAPTSLHWEVGNAFSAMLKRKRATATQIQHALEIYQRIPIRLIDVDLAEALGLADQLGIYAYDAYVLTCALNQNGTLLSLDGGLIHAAKQVGVAVLEVD